MSQPQPSQKPPVKVAVHHDLSIELHGENFSVRRALTLDEALGLIGMLSYVLRERVYTSPSEGVTR